MDAVGWAAAALAWPGSAAWLAAGATGGVAAALAGPVQPRGWRWAGAAGGAATAAVWPSLSGIAAGGGGCGWPGTKSQSGPASALTRAQLTQPLSDTYHTLQ